MIPRDRGPAGPPARAAVRVGRRERNGTIPNERAADPGDRGSTTADLAEAAGPGSVDGRHLLLVGAGPGLGLAVARRFAVGGYRVTLVARSTDGLRDLAGILADTGAKISTIAADASDPDGLGARMRELYLGNGAPGVIVYNAGGSPVGRDNARR